MPGPQVNERVKEAPARALRAMFAGIGSLLSVADKIRNRPAATTAAPKAPETVTPEDTATPETMAPETMAPETSAAPETMVPDTVTPEETVPAATGALPLANYDESSVASLRARLRNLSSEQLAQLIDYEKSHAARADVITMFERRIAKLAAEA